MVACWRALACASALVYILPVDELPPIPAVLLPDYPDPPRDLRWRLHRMAECFPAFGRDPAAGSTAGR